MYGYTVKLVLNALKAQFTKFFTILHIAMVILLLFALNKRKIGIEKGTV